MKLLVATTEKQGERDNDFFYCDEGEPVAFPLPCDCGSEDPDGECGCQRCMAGLISGKGTTTIKVVDNPNVTIDSSKELYNEYMVRSGMIKLLGDDFEEFANEEIEILIQSADEIPEGTVIEKRGDAFQARD